MRATYGISGAVPAPDERLGVMQCRHAGGDEAEAFALTRFLDAPLGILGLSLARCLDALGGSAKMPA